MSEPKKAYTHILTEKVGRVGSITLNQPDTLNALSHGLSQELIDTLNQYDTDPTCYVILLKGHEKAFSAGADIKEMTAKTFSQAYQEDFIGRTWGQVSKCRKPIIAAVSGYVLGGGLEIALMCDVILASSTAQFGLPEVKIGTIPGGGGTQRLSRVLGKALTMDMCLTGRRLSAEEAERLGLVSRLFPSWDVLELESLKLAQVMAEKSLPILLMVKEAINQSFETSLSHGLQFERRLFQSTFSLEDQKEGMRAFFQKRTPKFKNR